jgi:hypothetical protein
MSIFSVLARKINKSEHRPLNDCRISESSIFGMEFNNLKPDDNGIEEKYITRDSVIIPKVEGVFKRLLDGSLIARLPKNNARIKTIQKTEILFKYLE